MTNKRLIVLTLLGVLSVGCDRAPSPPQSGVQEEPRQQPARPKFPAKALESPLPDGFSLPFAYHVREDRVARVKDALTERRILVDVLDADVGSVRKQLTAMFKERGFLGTRPSENKGGQRVVYRHQDGRRVSVTYWSAEERKPKARGAEAVVYFGWAIPQ